MVAPQALTRIEYQVFFTTQSMLALAAPSVNVPELIPGVQTPSVVMGVTLSYNSLLVELLGQPSFPKKWSKRSMK
jgi:hypothetical protein